MTVTSPTPLPLVTDEFVQAALAWVRATLTGDAAPDARAWLDRVRPGSELDRMSRLFALTPADEDLLIFALAHRIDGSVAALCSQVAGTAHQGYVTAHLLARTVGGGDPGFAAALFERLTALAPLRRWALVDMRETHPLAAIALEESVALRLAGWHPEGTAPPGCSLLPPGPTLKRIALEAGALAARLAHGVALIGPAGSGRRAMATSLARQAGLRPVMLNDGLAVPQLRAIAREARLDGLAVVIDADPDEAALRQFTAADEDSRAAELGDGGRKLAGAALEVLGGGALIVLARQATGLPAGLYRHRLSPLTDADRETLWRAALAPGCDNGGIGAVARQFPLGPAEIAEIAATLRPGDAPGTLWQLCRNRGGQGLEALAARIVPRFGWEDLVLPAPVLSELRAVADQMRHRATVYDTWGFSRRLAAGRGVTALLAGPSGVGKTMAAEVIAGDLGLDLYKVDLSRLVSKYIGETEKNLRRVFDAAEETGACLFLDEADACLGKRSEVKDSHDRHANIEVSYLLQRMESYSGLCLLATNLKNNLDAAFLRRLRFVIDIPLPDQGDRMRIWQGAFPRGTPTEGLDFAALARLDISGGSIMVIAVNAAFLAAAGGHPVSMGCIGRAARGEFRKHDRTFRPTWTEAGG